MKKNIKKIGVLFLSVLLILGVMNSKVYAASVSASLNSDKTKVTTYYSSCYGSTIVYVRGYEYHPTAHIYILYEKSKSTTVSGAKTFYHNTDEGFKFQDYYDGEQLTSKVVVNGSVVATMEIN